MAIVTAWAEFWPRGGMGRIQEALDNRLERPVAVKFLKQSADMGLRSAFFWEARLMARLDHPGMLPIFDVGEDQDGSPYFVMKRLRG